MCFEQQLHLGRSPVYVKHFYSSAESGGLALGIVNFMYDLWMLNNNGVAKLHNAMSEITTNIFAFKVAITKAPTLLAIYSSTIIPQHLIYPTITSYTKELAKNITDVEEKTGRKNRCEREY
jgi:hypothetical protein